MKEKVFIISYYFNLRDSDRAYSAYQYFKQRNYEVKLICGNYDHSSKKKIDYGMDDVLEVPVVRYKKNISFKRIYSNLKFALDTKKIIKKETPFNIGFVIGPPNATGYFVNKEIHRKGALFVLDIFDLYPETIPVNEKLKKILKYFGFGIWAYFRDASIQKADIFTVSCRYYFIRLNLQENDKQKVIPLCKDDKDMFEIKKLPTDEIRIVYLGALTGNYDFEGLVSLMDELKKNGTPAKLFIIGDGYNKDWLLSSLQEKGIKYEFFGRVYDESFKQTIFEQCHFGYNGFKENASIALSYKSMEYMSNGIALINSCKEDTWDLVENRNIGLNYQHGQMKILAEKIISLSADAIHKMKMNAFEVYVEEYSFSKYCERMDNIFAPHNTK